MPAPLDPNSAARPGSGIFGLDFEPEDAGVVLLPVPFDATASYRRGAAEAPAAVLEASHQIDLFDPRIGRPYAAGICLLEEPEDVIAWNALASAAADPVLEAGGLLFTDEEGEALRAKAERVDALCGQMVALVEREALKWLGRGKIFGVLGGDHSVALGALRAAAAREPGLGVLQVDAHADLRQAFGGLRYSHASVMFNALQECPGISRLVQVGVRDLCDAEYALIQAGAPRVVTHLDASLQSRRLAGTPWQELVEGVLHDLPERVWISVDIDGLDPSLCPNTGTPVPGGLSFAELDVLLAALATSSRRVVGFDLCEVSPGPDDRDDWDANVGMRVLYKLCGWALRSQGRIASI
ncbi:MAG: arginase family protein [Deltaproteobacteria bacterium]|nr:arginase family protein [Deltaproteobacteria bacterium]